MIAALALVAAMALPTRYGEQVTEVSRADHGRFAFVEERHELPPGQMRLHGPADRWIELHLRFRSDDSGATFELVDNGAMLGFRLDSRECTSSTNFLAYRGRIGEPALFAGFLDILAFHYRSCPRTDPATARADRAAMRAARADFALAVQAMKARAQTLFQGWRTRCRARISGGRRAGPVILMPDHGPCGGGVL